MTIGSRAFFGRVTVVSSMLALIVAGLPSAVSSAVGDAHREPHVWTVSGGGDR